MSCMWGIQKKITKLPLMLKRAEMRAAGIKSLGPPPLDLGQSLQRNLLLWARRLEREGKITDGQPGLPATHVRRPPGEAGPPLPPVKGALARVSAGVKEGTNTRPVGQVRAICLPALLIHTEAEQPEDGIFVTAV